MDDKRSTPHAPSIRWLSGLTTLTTLVAMSIILVSSALSGSPYQVVETHDDMLNETGSIFDGFGGLFLDADDNSIIYVYMMDPAQKQEAERLVATWASHGAFPAAVREVRVLKADYPITRLKAWYDELSYPIGSVPSLASTDLNEGINRIHVGVSEAEDIATVEALLSLLGIPKDAVLVEVVEPFRHLILEE